jgi:hypothetical protein
MNKMITIALAALSGAVIVLFIYSLELFGIHVFNFSSSTYLVSYVSASLIIMAIKTLNIKDKGNGSANKVLAVWKIDDDQNSDLIITKNNVISNGKIRHSWNDYNRELLSADIVRDSYLNSVLFIVYKNNNNKLNSVQLPIPYDRSEEANQVANSLKTLIK